MSEIPVMLLTPKEVEALRGCLAAMRNRPKQVNAAADTKLRSEIALLKNALKEMDTSTKDWPKEEMMDASANVQAPRAMSFKQDDNRDEPQHKADELFKGEHDAKAIEKLRLLCRLPAIVSADGVVKPSGLQIISKLAEEIMAKATPLANPHAEEEGCGCCMIADEGFIKHNGVPYVAITAAIGPNGEDETFECPAILVNWCAHHQSAPPEDATFRRR